MSKLFRIPFFLVCMFTLETLYSQSGKNIPTGLIEYERKIDMFAFLHEISTTLKNEDVEDKYSKLNPQFYTDTFSCLFGSNTAIYKPKAHYQSGQNEILDFWMQMSGQNIVYSDFDQSTSIRSKNVLGNNYWVKDSIPRIKWKLETEKREIAGYLCRRADAVILDSIYVVAFFTDQITTPGGPESFSGLPGMILGAVIPSIHISWYAIKIVAQPTRKNEQLLPNKGKPIRLDEFKTELQKITSNNPFKELIVKNALL